LKAPQPKQIWIIEDDLGAQFVYREILGMHYQLHFIQDLKEYEKSNLLPAPDLLIADLKLGDRNFMEVFDGSNEGAVLKSLLYPVIIVSSVDDLEILRRCFKEGARDYLTKPFHKNELWIKVDRALAETSNRTDAFKIDFANLRVLRNGKKPADLTAKELQILSVLNGVTGQAVSRRQIETEVWRNVRVTPKTLDVHLVKLRRKLAPLDLEIRHMPPSAFALVDRIADPA